MRWLYNRIFRGIGIVIAIGAITALYLGVIHVTQKH